MTYGMAEPSGIESAGITTLSIPIRVHLDSRQLRSGW
jgi:hypothetical protein